MIKGVWVFLIYLFKYINTLNIRESARSPRWPKSPLRWRTFHKLKVEMGLCKCPKKKVTNLFCFEHRVNVCEHCLVANHPNVSCGRRHNIYLTCTVSNSRTVEHWRFKKSHDDVCLFTTTLAICHSDNFEKYIEYLRPVKMYYF